MSYDTRRVTSRSAIEYELTLWNSKIESVRIIAGLSGWEAVCLQDALSENPPDELHELLDARDAVAEEEFGDMQTHAIREGDKP